MEHQEPISYKAEVHIRGVVTQKIYGKNLDKLRTRAIKMLTLHKPGFDCTHPKYISLFQSVQSISRNLTIWKLLEEIPFKSLSEDQMEWRTEEKRRETLLAEKPF